jgi:hypothetical protein
LCAQGVPGLTLTPDHKVLARKSGWVRQRDGAERVAPAWLEAAAVRGGYVNLKLPEPQAPAVTDTLTWWIAGRWIADGHWDARGSALLSCGKHETENLLAKLGSRAGGAYDCGTAIQIRLLDRARELRGILDRCGASAAGKHLPPCAFTLPKEQAEALLAGYLSGDGHFLKSRRRWMASSVSRALLLGVAALAQRVHGAIAAVYPGRPARTARIQGRVVQCRQDWGLSFDVPAPRRKSEFVLDDGAWKMVRTIRPAGEVETWNLRVEEDESYTAEGCIVKNCPMPFDIVNRLIEQFSMEGELVFDPFAGLGTVPYCAVKKRRRGLGVELCLRYFLEAGAYCAAAARDKTMPSLLDVMQAEEVAAVPLPDELAGASA